MVGDARHAGLFGAIGAAEKVFFGFDAVTDDFTAAMRADRSKPVITSNAK
jgi:hypothetical protein